MNAFPQKSDDDDEDECPTCPSEDKTSRPSLDREVAESFLKSRRIFLWGPVDDKMARDVISRLLYLDQQSHDDITIYLNSPGGVISSGLAILDAMDFVRSDVATVCMGQAASMGAVLLAHGARGKRSAWPHARIMIHQPLIHGHMVGPASDLQIQAEEMLRTRNVLNRLLASDCGKEPECIEADTDRDHFLSATDAVNYGLIDRVDVFDR